jgi:hypothetical protein
MSENQENELEVGFRTCLWFVFALAHLDAGGTVPDSWRTHIPEVDMDRLRPVSLIFCLSYILSTVFIFLGTLLVAKGS